MKRLLLLTVLSALAVSSASAKDFKLLNVSYDPTAQLYADYDKLFAGYWAQKTGVTPP